MAATFNFSFLFFPDYFHQYRNTLPLSIFNNLSEFFTSTDIFKFVFPTTPYLPLPTPIPFVSLISQLGV